MLVLLRHGEATGNAAHLLLGRTDSPLTEHGRDQAVALGPSLGEVVRIISSPLRRALDTARALETAVPVEVDQRWVELDYGEHEGRPLRDVPVDLWQHWSADPEYRPAGGESLADVGRRVAEACTELFAQEGEAARDPAGDVVVVSHVSPIKAAVGWVLGADDSVAWRLHLSTGSITRVGWGARGPVLHSYNWVPPAVSVETGGGPVGTGRPRVAPS